MGPLYLYTGEIVHTRMGQYVHTNVVHTNVRSSIKATGKSARTRLDAEGVRNYGLVWAILGPGRRQLCMCAIVRPL